MYPVRGFVPRPLVCMLLGFESHTFTRQCICSPNVACIRACIRDSRLMFGPRVEALWP